MDNFSIKEFALKEFDREMPTTRKLLERVPFDKADWKPHDKSTNLGRLASHVAILPGMMVDIIEKDKLVFTGGGPGVSTNTEELLATFDKRSAASRAALEGTTDEHLLGNWQLWFGERNIFDDTRIVAYRMLMMNHLIHHRAQLGVYLRLNNVAIPGSYGPSADEPM